MAADRGTRSTPAWLQAAQDQWTNRGQQRPPFAIEPQDGQESVWDYPRPPLLVRDQREVVVTDPNDPDRELARTTEALRLLETASPPTFYLPATDVNMDMLHRTDGSSFCEWKGPAAYFGLPGEPQPVGWSYPNPFEQFAELAGWISFYPGRVHCTVAGETVQAQAGGFYGGWITAEVVGPFKGDAGTSGW